ncbi:MAG: hypothetical protein ABSG08_16635 [Terriglobales bacterium]
MAEQSTKSAKKAFRSPNHPAFDLTEAIAKAATVYEKERRSPTTPQVIVKHMGYSHTHGPGGRALSGLRQYGLIEESGGHWKISDTGFAILQYPEGSQERHDAIKKAAVSPTLFRELREQYPDSLPSDETLKATLLKRGFNPTAIDDLIGHFRSTMALAGLTDVSYTDSAEGNKMSNLNPEIPPKPPIPSALLPGVQTYSFALSPDARAELTLRGAVTPDDLDLLRDHIELTIKALARKVKNQ